MRAPSKLCANLFVFLVLNIGLSSAYSTNNQTDELSPILPGLGLPFSIVIEQANFQLPVGIHSGLVGEYKGLWVFIAGRTSGIHGFHNPDNNNFPIQGQNTSIYVVNPSTGLVSSRSLYDPSSGLNQIQIDTLSVTNPQGYQDGGTLYMTGGYGIDTNTGTFTTKPVLTAINLQGIVEWVTEPGNTSHSVFNNIRQMDDPIFQITGGRMFKLGNITQLIFGQNFTGLYTDASNGDYSEQVRQFHINGVNGQLSIDIYPSKPKIPDPNFRRRDLNVVPVLLNRNNRLKEGFVAYSGVFTPSSGVWTVPVVLDETSNPMMADPLSPTAFKQGMNQYECATASLYSKKNRNMYNVFFGGLSYAFYLNGVLETSPIIPFINQVTTVKMDDSGHFTQYLMANEYPVILSISPQPNPGNTLLFGANAHFIPNHILQYPNKIISLDAIREPTVIGYIAGGIASTEPNAIPIVKSFASPYVFRVTLVPS